MDGKISFQTLIRVEDSNFPQSQNHHNLELNFGLVGDTGKAAADAIVKWQAAWIAFVQSPITTIKTFTPSKKGLKSRLKTTPQRSLILTAQWVRSIYDRGGLREFVDTLDLTNRSRSRGLRGSAEFGPSLVDLGNAPGKTGRDHANCKARAGSDG